MWNFLQEVKHDQNLFRSLNPLNIDLKRLRLDIPIWFPLKGSFLTSLSGWTLTILPDIQRTNRIVISDHLGNEQRFGHGWPNMDVTWESQLRESPSRMSSSYDDKE